jgi:hypothetical protein
MGSVNNGYYWVKDEDGAFFLLEYENGAWLFFGDECPEKDLPENWSIHSKIEPPSEK